MYAGSNRSPLEKERTATAMVYSCSEAGSSSLMLRADATFVYNTTILLFNQGSYYATLLKVVRFDKAEHTTRPVD